MKYLLEEIKAILEGIPQGEWSFEDNEMCIEGVPICTFFTAEDFPCVPIEDEPKLEEELKRLKSFNTAAPTIIRDLLAENERLSALAATHLADQELLVGQERKRVARECIDYVNNHASDCGCSKRIAHDIRERYGVEE